MHTIKEFSNIKTYSLYLFVLPCIWDSLRIASQRQKCRCLIKLCIALILLCAFVCWWMWLNVRIMHGMCTIKFALTRVLETLIDTWLIQRSNQVIHYCIPSTGSCFFSSFMAQQSLLGQGLPIVESSRLHSDTPHSVWLLWTSDQR